MREILNYYLEDTILFIISENSLFFLFFAFIKKILILISQISRYFEFLSRYFFIFLEKSVLYLKSLKKFKLLKIVLLSSSIESEESLSRFKIIKKD